MLVSIDGEKVVLDSRITIEKESSGEYKVSSPDAAVTVEAGSIQDNSAAFKQPWEEYDPKFYKTSTNNLTISRSVDRAFTRILEEMWSEFEPAEIYAGGDELSSSIEKLIREGKGRDAAYSIAGGIKAGYKEGKYKGVPLAYIFKGIVDGAIRTPEKITARDFGGSSKTYFGRYA